MIGEDYPCLGRVLLFTISRVAKGNPGAGVTAGAAAAQGGATHWAGKLVAQVHVWNCCVGSCLHKCMSGIVVWSFRGGDMQPSLMIAIAPRVEPKVWSPTCGALGVSRSHPFDSTLYSHTSAEGAPGPCHLPLRLQGHGDGGARPEGGTPHLGLCVIKRRRGGVGANGILPGVNEMV